MKGSEAKIFWFMEGADKRYLIPVYQRKYDWKQDNCRQLYEDLKKVIRENRVSHFFGSIVSSVVANGSKVEYHIIDGQQRLTTVTLLLLAMRNLLAQGKITSHTERLHEQIEQRFLIAPWAQMNDRIKLRPIRRDKDALERLFGAEEDYDRASNLTANYLFFCELLLHGEETVDALYDALGRLEIISITLDGGDQAQLIFESLNSTGLALNEGDKIRNYILMGLPTQKQNELYETYWEKIEKCTVNDVSTFMRDYLSIKQQVTPNISNVYRDFKQYAESAHLPVGELLADILRYARFYERIFRCGSESEHTEQDACLHRMARLEIGVTRPFLMEVLRLNQDEILSGDEIVQIFRITENYLFRRSICDVPTNALNKIFLNLNREIMRYADGSPAEYVGKFIYALLSKKDSGRFPNDEEFGAHLSHKLFYPLRGKSKAYLFERLENYDTVETKDIYGRVDANIYTIEHIMPQKLTPTWTAALGENAAEIHEVWCHRLANLTLTAYNSNLSNMSFVEKRDMKGGYRDSGLRMNQKIAGKDTWGLAELEERDHELVARAKEIWAYPQTSFRPIQRELDSCTLDDEHVDLTGREIVRYRYRDTEQVVFSWVEMFEHILKFLHSQDKTVLFRVASDTNIPYLATYIGSQKEKLRMPLRIDEGIYVEKHSATIAKLATLRRLFDLYKADPSELVFYLKS